MKITKLGHCSLIIEDGDAKILTDPGAYSDAQNTITGITHIFITHEHADHYHLPSLKQVLVNNPRAIIYTNSAVGKLLEAEGISYHKLEEGEKDIVGGVSVEGIGHEHLPMYPTLPKVMNTGYMFGGRLFHPGDSLTIPQQPVEILALPVVGLWATVTQALDFAMAVKPKVCFPVHDGMLKFLGPYEKVPGSILPEQGIDYKVLELGKPYEF